MTLPANIRVNIGAPFPAMVKGSGPVAISKQNGIWTVGLNFTGLNKAAAIPDPVNGYVLVWNALTGVFSLVLATEVGPAVVQPTAVVFAMSPYTPLLADRVLLVDTSGGPVTIQMPLSATRGGHDLEVKDVAGGAAANPITVSRAGAELIDGMINYPIDGAFAGAVFGPKAAGGYFVHA